MNGFVASERIDALGQFSYKRERELFERYGHDHALRTADLAQLAVRGGDEIFTDPTGDRLLVALEALELMGREGMTPQELELAPAARPTLTDDYTPQELERVRTTLETVPSADGERALLLRAIDGWTWEDVAADLGQKASGVRAKAQRAAGSFTKGILGGNLAGCGQCDKELPSLIYGLCGDRVRAKEQLRITTCMEHVDDCEVCGALYAELMRALKVARAMLVPVEREGYSVRVSAAENVRTSTPPPVAGTDVAAVASTDDHSTSSALLIDEPELAVDHAPIEHENAAPDHEDDDRYNELAGENTGEADFYIPESARRTSRPAFFTAAQEPTTNQPPAPDTLSARFFDQENVDPRAEVAFAAGQADYEPFQAEPEQSPPAPEVAEDEEAATPTAPAQAPLDTAALALSIVAALELRDERRREEAEAARKNQDDEGTAEPAESLSAAEPEPSAEPPAEIYEFVATAEEETSAPDSSDSEPSSTAARDGSGAPQAEAIEIEGQPRSGRSADVKKLIAVETLVDEAAEDVEESSGEDSAGGQDDEQQAAVSQAPPSAPLHLVTAAEDDDEEPEQETRSTYVAPPRPMGVIDPPKGTRRLIVVGDVDPENDEEGEDATYRSAADAADDREFRKVYRRAVLGVAAALLLMLLLVGGGLGPFDHNDQSPLTVPAVADAQSNKPVKAVKKKAKKRVKKHRAPAAPVQATPSPVQAPPQTQTYDSAGGYDDGSMEFSPGGGT